MICINFCEIPKYQWYLKTQAIFKVRTQKLNFNESKKKKKTKTPLSLVSKTWLYDKFMPLNQQSGERGFK